MYKNVFVNRTLNLRKIKAIGLDMDHTLVQYHTDKFEKLAHHCMKKKLVDKGYPKEILDLPFNFDETIRGLVVDQIRGNLLKVSRHCAIRASRHGTKKLSFVEQQNIYAGTYIDLGDPNFSAIDTSFSISVAILYSQIVDIKEANPSANIPDFSNLFQDVVRVLDESHRDGSLKDIVTDELDTYVITNPKLVEGLERYKKHGKYLFICTNSDYHYTKTLLDYAINPFLKDHKSWVDLFSIVITHASKPRFFHDNLSFLKVNEADGSMTNFDAPLTNGIYQGGCAKVLERDLKLDGEDILYVGDHIYGDIVRLKKDCQWRTALVLEELGQEIIQMKQAEPIQNQIRDLMTKKEPLEHQLCETNSKKIEENTDAYNKEIDMIQQNIAHLDKQIRPLIKQQVSIFNSHWGEVMRAGNEESYFAQQVDRYADIYMPELGDLFACSPRTYFRAKRRPLAHEQALSLILDDEE